MREWPPEMDDPCLIPTPGDDAPLDICAMRNCIRSVLSADNSKHDLNRREQLFRAVTNRKPS